MAKPSVLVIGSSNTDLVIKAARILKPGETMLGGEFARAAGGKGANQATAARAANKLLARGVQNVIITMGARGAFVTGKDVQQMIPGFKVNAVDATGAGDVFNGALVVGLAEGRSLLEAARFASAAAAISVTRFGAQLSAPTRTEIQTLLTTGKVLPGSKTRRPK